MPPIEDVEMIDPPPARSIKGIAYFMPRNAERRLTAMKSSKMSAVMSAMVWEPPSPGPALLKTT